MRPKCDNVTEWVCLECLAHYVSDADEGAPLTCEGCGTELELVPLETAEEAA